MDPAHMNCKIPRCRPRHIFATAGPHFENARQCIQVRTVKLAANQKRKFDFMFYSSGFQISTRDVIIKELARCRKMSGKVKPGE